MRKQYYINSEGSVVDVFSGKQLAHLLNKRKMKVSKFYRALVMRGFDRSQPMLYRWMNGQSEPRAGDISLMAHVLGCDKDDFYEDESRVN